MFPLAWRIQQNDGDPGDGYFPPVIPAQAGIQEMQIRFIAYCRLAYGGMKWHGHEGPCGHPRR